MIKPKNKLPWKITYDIDALKNKSYFIMNDEGTTIVSDDLYFKKQPGVEDAEYIIKAVNEYPELIDFLERLESSTQDTNTAYKIRNFLREKEIW